MVIWGGTGSGSRLRTGGRYTPANNSWSATSTGPNVPVARAVHSAVWSGEEILVWGGIPTNAIGGRYCVNPCGRLDSDGDGIGDLCDFTLLGPVDGAVFSASGPMPVFTWGAGGQNAYQVEFSLTASPFVPVAFGSSKFKPGTKLSLSTRAWSRIVPLGAGGVPVYWRVAGKAGSPTKTYSDQVFSFVITP